MKDRYTLRVKEADFKLTAKDKPRILLNCEIIEPQVKVFDGVTYDLTGINIPYYLMMDTPEGLGAILALHKTLGLPDELDTDNPNVEIYSGLCFESILDSNERKAIKPDPENPKKYISILDAEGKEISQGWQVMGNSRDVLHRRADLEANEQPKF